MYWSYERLERRVYEHKNKRFDGFTKKYNVNKLVYYESTDDVKSAIARGKANKGWLRRRKDALIEKNNTKWADLSGDWKILRSLHSLIMTRHMNERGEIRFKDNV